MAHSNTTKHPQPVSEPVSTVPGLGPIRIRSLIKAGYLTTDDLRRATPDLLATVPGITPQIAQRITQHVNGAGAAGQDDGVAGYAAVSREVSVQIGALLAYERADDYTPALARQLGKLAMFIDQHGSIGADSQAQKRATELLQEVGRLLQVYSTSGKNGAKRQVKLAEALRDQRKKLKAVVK